MGFFTTVKVVFFLFIAVMVGIFYSQNTFHVPIQFPFARPYQFRLIYMLMISFCLGFFLSTIIGMRLNSIKARKEKMEENEELVEEEGH